MSTPYFDEHLTTSDWFETEGMTTGRLYLLYSGPTIGYPSLPTYIGEANLLKEHVFDYFGPDLQIRDLHEKCGNETCDGTVVGFVRLNRGQDCIIAADDEIIESGWELADQ